MEKTDIVSGKEAIMKMSLYEKDGKRKVLLDKTEDISVEIVGMVKGSRTRCTVRVSERGRGWSENLQKYVGVRSRSGWFRGDRKDCGELYETHIDKLVKVDRYE